MVARLLREQEVAGSNPVSPTISVEAAQAAPIFSAMQPGAPRRAPSCHEQAEKVAAGARRARCAGRPGRARAHQRGHRTSTGHPPGGRPFTSSLRRSGPSWPGRQPPTAPPSSAGCFSARPVPTFRAGETLPAPPSKVRSAGVARTPPDRGCPGYRLGSSSPRSSTNRPASDGRRRMAARTPAA